MNKAEQVIEYLEALARELLAMAEERGMDCGQYHFLVSGGASMLLQYGRRSTLDIDFVLVESPPPRRPVLNKVIRITVQHGFEIATRASETLFSQAVGSVARVYGLPVDWLNDESASYLYHDAPKVDAYLWRSFANVLYVYLPVAEYLFALKITAYRRKDRQDCKTLMRILNIQTPEQARLLIDKYVRPDAQVFWMVEKKLKQLFR